MITECFQSSGNLSSRQIFWHNENNASVPFSPAATISSAEIMSIPGAFPLFRRRMASASSSLESNGVLSSVSCPKSSGISDRTESSVGLMGLYSSRKCSVHRSFISSGSVRIFPFLSFMTCDSVELFPLIFLMPFIKFPAFLLNLCLFYLLAKTINKGLLISLATALDLPAQKIVVLLLRRIINASWFQSPKFQFSNCWTKFLVCGISCSILGQQRWIEFWRRKCDHSALVIISKQNMPMFIRKNILLRVSQPTWAKESNKHIGGGGDLSI